MRLIITFNNKNWALPEPWVPDYLCFEAIEAGTVKFEAPNGFSQYLGEPNLEYSFDTNTWTTLHINDTVSLQANDKIYFRGLNPNGFTYGRGGQESGTMYMNCLWCTSRYNVSGNIMTLIDKKGTTTTIPNADCFGNLFVVPSSYSANGKIVNASNLKLPATTIQAACYRNLFNGNSLLTYPPQILPATTLSDLCYTGMFNGCTSLLESPILPASILVSKCYNATFYNCSSLKKVTTYASNISATNCLLYWMTNVSNTGDFYNLGGANYPSGANGIPSGWTVHTSL